MTDNIKPADQFVNRELSWLAFNQRVLDEALDPTNPLFERLRFLTIFHTNLDEFFMVRVSGIKSQVTSGVDVLTQDGLTPRMQLSHILNRVAPLVEEAQSCLSNEILPSLKELGVEIVHYNNLKAQERKRLDEVYESAVHPMLTPLAVGPTHPFPFISNLSLNIALFVQSIDDGEARLARVKVPLANLPRLVILGEDTRLEPPLRLLPIEDLIAANLNTLFPGMKLSKPYLFRVTRDADLEIREDEADDLLDTLQQELRKRRFGEAVRLEVQEGMPEEICLALRNGLGLKRQDVVPIKGLLGVPQLSQLLKIDLPELKFTPFSPKRAKFKDLFGSIRQSDILLHHPFDSFDTVVDFVQNAAKDPHVVAIKQTLYRTSGNSPVIRALEAAVEAGKQVAAVVELRARFDEENNIVWAQRLEQAGVHVIYGVPGLKTHCKLTLVVRREGKELRRYAHIGTGNYNPTTARIYTDLGLLTCNPDLTSDVADLFNRLTGFARPTGYDKLLVAPHYMKASLLQFIDEERSHGKNGQIIVKCNAITDSAVISALYEASRAGVQIDLLVRGICSLVPGVQGMSENIRVRSVIGRFLEHTRVLWFSNAGNPRCYIGSADWMERNLENRVEVLAPIVSPQHLKWIREFYLQRYLDDVGRSREMLFDTTYQRTRQSKGSTPDVHQQFMTDKARIH